MIHSFADELTEQVFHGIYSHAVRTHLTSYLVKKAQRRMDILNCAKTMDSLEMLPEIKTEGVVRDAHNHYSIPLFENYRLAFRWNGQHPEHVEIKL
jgi:toxin HigB-1